MSKGSFILGLLAGLLAALPSVASSSGPFQPIAAPPGHELVLRAGRGESPPVEGLAPDLTARIISATRPLSR